MQAQQRKRAAWGDMVVGLIILIAAAILAALLFSRSEQAMTAQVVLDGEVILSCRLDVLEETQLIPVEGEYSLVLEMSSAGVRVVKTQCPGEDCMHMGMISQAGEQIVCLPNRMVVSLHGNDAGYDAVTG